MSLAAFQGQNEEQILTGLALAGILTGQLAGSSLRQCLVVATVRLAIEISVLGTRQQTLTVSRFPHDIKNRYLHWPQASYSVQELL